MVCSICGQTGHNRRTCPQQNITGLSNRITQPIPPRLPPNRLTLEGRRGLTRIFWKTTIKTIINLQRFAKVTLFLSENKENRKYAYFHWLKNKDLYNLFPYYPQSFGACIVGIIYPNISHYRIRILNEANESCLKFHKERNPVIDNSKKIKLINMKYENYLIYWVVGNIMVEDIDSRENRINYMGMLRKNDTFRLNT